MSRSTRVVIGQERATCLSLLNDTSEDLYRNSSIGCSANFDRSLCWLGTELNQTARRSCPFNYCTEVPGCDTIATQYKVQRLCQANGEWADAVYTQCIEVINYHRECIAGFCRECPNKFKEWVLIVSLTLIIVSVALLVFALVLFSIFDSIQCRRLSIHKNLATAFVFRFAVLAIWMVSQHSRVFQDCSSFQERYIAEYEWMCKVLLLLVMYFQVASVVWMLIEGAYLYSRFTMIAMRHIEAPYYVYLLCGWAVPLIVVFSWSVVHAHQSSNRHYSLYYCWLPYSQGFHMWILAGTMSACLVLNLLFLLGIVVILAQKLRAENTVESRKIWRTIKATLLLVPLLGISNIPLFYEPQEPSGAYMLGSAILQNSQGIFIAILYCFLNSEIQNAVKRQLSKVPFHLFRFRRRHESYGTERTYIPEMQKQKNQRHGVPMEEMTIENRNRI
ncbi:hypothetical protein AB6A40_001333 [Gnathostoma spinigerum]|uniref:Uncharacterized protein n=1 Tax=Gnathostoma spinigerum TaxID=75299 RepID=A0ABD6E3X2_9BILA